MYNPSSTPSRQRQETMLCTDSTSRWFLGYFSTDSTGLYFHSRISAIDSEMAELVWFPMEFTHAYLYKTVVVGFGVNHVYNAHSSPLIMSWEALSNSANLAREILPCEFRGDERRCSLLYTYMQLQTSDFKTQTIHRIDDIGAMNERTRRSISNAITNINAVVTRTL